MRKTVHSKLICSYIFIGIVGFLFATAGGSHFVETYLEEEVGARLYDSAVRFASDAVTIQQVADNDSKGLEKIMDILASGEEAGILILDKNFHVIVQSSNLEYNVSSAKSTADSEVQTSETDKIPENGTSSEKFSAANTISIPPELQDKYLNIISHEADRLEKLTRSLLVLNDLDERKRMMNIRKFDINDVIKNTANTFEVICSKKNIDLELLLSGRELFVEADMEQIQQVLYNLLDNAIKFSNDNSSINIETSVKNDKVFVSVKDHGVGIPKDSLSKVWDRFYKTDTSRGKDRKGTGLGLSIVKEIIKAHNQNINVISTEGVGTEFIFTLKKAK